MRLPLARVIRDLAGGSSHAFAGLLTAQLDATQEAAQLGREVVAGRVSAGAAQAQMQEIEHRGDDFRVQLTAALSTSLVTPIDREDLYRVSRSIDDVLDNLRDFLREWDLFGLTEGGAMEPLLDAVAQAIGRLREAAGALDGPPERVTALAQESHRAETEIRRLYEQQLARLFRGEVTMDVLKTRDLLRRIDVVGLRLGEAADALSDGAVKRTA